MTGRVYISIMTLVVVLIAVIYALYAQAASVLSIEDVSLSLNISRRACFKACIENTSCAFWSHFENPSPQTILSITSTLPSLSHLTPNPRGLCVSIPSNSNILNLLSNRQISSGVTLHPRSQGNNYRIHSLLSRPVVGSVSSSIGFPMNFLRGCSYTISLWVWLWKPKDLIHRNMEYVVFNTRHLDAQMSPGSERILPAIIWNVGRAPGSFFISGTKDRHGDYNGIWLTEYDIQYHSWIHIALSINSDEFEVYINGKLLRRVLLDQPLMKPILACPYIFPPFDIAQDDNDNEYVDNSLFQLFGHPHHANTQGMIHDLVIISNHQSNASEVASLMNSNPPPKEYNDATWDNILQGVGVYSLRGMDIPPDWRRDIYLQFSWNICPQIICGQVCVSEEFFVNPPLRTPVFPIFISSSTLREVISSMPVPRILSPGRKSSDQVIDDALTELEGLMSWRRETLRQIVDMIEAYEEQGITPSPGFDPNHPVQLNDLDFDLDFDPDALLDPDSSIPDLGYMDEFQAYEYANGLSVPGAEYDERLILEQLLMTKVSLEQQILLDEATIGLYNLDTPTKSNKKNEDSVISRSPQKSHHLNATMKKIFAWPIPLTIHHLLPLPKTTTVIPSPSSRLWRIPTLKDSWNWLWNITSNSSHTSSAMRQSTEWSQKISSKQDKLLQLLLYSPNPEKLYTAQQVYDSAMLWSHQRYVESAYLRQSYRHSSRIPSNISTISANISSRVSMHLDLLSHEVNSVASALTVYIWLCGDNYDPAIDFTVRWNFLYPQVSTQTAFLILGYQARYGNGLTFEEHVSGVIHRTYKSYPELRLSDIFTTAKPMSPVYSFDDNSSYDHPSSLVSALQFSKLTNNKLSQCKISTAYYFPLTQYVISHYESIENIAVAYLSSSQGGLHGGFGGGGPSFQKGAQGETERELFELQELLARHGNIDAQHFLAQRYYWGGYYHQGVYYAAPNYEMAVWYYLQAGQGGQHLSSLYSLGVLYLNGQPDDHQVNLPLLGDRAAPQLDMKAPQIGRFYDQRAPQLKPPKPNNNWNLGNLLFGKSTSIAPEGISQQGKIQKNFTLAYKYIHQAAYGYPSNDREKWLDPKFSLSEEALEMLLDKGYPMAVHALGNLHNDANKAQYYNHTLAMLYYEAAAYLDSPQGHFSYGANLINDALEFLDYHNIDDSEFEALSLDFEIGIIHLNRAIAHGHVRAMNYLAHALYDPNSWLHHHVKFQIWVSENISFLESKPLERKNHNQRVRLNSILRIDDSSTRSSSENKRYRVWKIDPSRPLSIEFNLPGRRHSLPLMSLMRINSTSSSYAANRSSSSTPSHVHPRKNATNFSIKWLYKRQDWCDMTLALVKYISEFQPSGASIATMSANTLAPVLDSHRPNDIFATSIWSIQGEDDLGQSSLLPSNAAILDALGMLDLIDAGAEMGYQQVQLRSYQLYHRILVDICPALIEHTTNNSAANASTSVYQTSNGLFRSILSSTLSKMYDVFKYIAEKKFSSHQSDEYLFRGTGLPLSGGIGREFLPAWIANMTYIQCHEYFEAMSVRRLFQLASQGHKPSKRILATTILGIPRRKHVANLPLRSSASDGLRELVLDGVSLLSESCNYGDVEALLELGWFVYFDPYGLSLNQTLASRIFDIAYIHESSSDSSTYGVLSALAIASYRCLEALKGLRVNVIAWGIGFEELSMAMLTSLLVVLGGVYILRRR